MAMDFDPRGWNRRPVYLSVTGVITQMQMTTVNGSGYGGCTQLITVEDELASGYQVSDGLKAGDRIITNPDAVPKEGAPVSVSGKGR